MISGGNGDHQLDIGERAHHHGGLAPNVCRVEGHLREAGVAGWFWPLL